MKTKNDLSFQEATLDYEAMLRTARIAVYEVQGRIQDYDKQLHKALSEDSTSLLRLIPEWMEREVGKLSVCAETLASLIGGLERAHVTIVNRNITKEAQEYLESEEGDNES
jgi:hypothetical protein